MNNILTQLFLKNNLGNPSDKLKSLLFLSHLVDWDNEIRILEVKHEDFIKGVTKNEKLERTTELEEYQKELDAQKNAKNRNK